MTTKELIDNLKIFPDDTPIFIYSDKTQTFHTPKEINLYKPEEQPTLTQAQQEEFGDLCPENFLPYGFLEETMTIKEKEESPFFKEKINGTIGIKKNTLLIELI
jgi:hypothetical protein